MSSSDTLAPSQDQQHSSIMLEFRLALERMSILAKSHGDAVHAEKFRELSDKLKLNRLTVAFCGHFSAGKSSLVNALCGAVLLPASPIPTSANVVTIINGRPSAKTVFRDSNGTVFPARQIQVEQLHDFAVDGEGVTSIEVSYPIPLLGEHMAIVDTPGVDSTDDAHRAATESALHLADVVFYVTDYNHVQSEVNFRFLRSLARWGKPTYVIVNQIDKHREEQIAFAAFQDSLRQALSNWDIKPAGMLFLSLRELNHPLSQWSELQDLFISLQPLAVPLMLRSAERSAAHLSEQFREALQHQNQDQREALQLRLGENGASDLRDSLRTSLLQKLNEIKGMSVKRRETVRVELDRLLGNANLTPAETRDKAKEVLEAMQSGFKAGWLAGAAKTEAERSRRLERLSEDFNKQVTAHITGHLKAMLREEALEAGLKDDLTEVTLDKAFEAATPEWLKQRVKPGAGAEGQAVLHYSAEISTQWKAFYRKAALQWFDDLQQLRKPKLDAAAEALNMQLAELDKKDEAAEELATLEASERAKESELLACLPAIDKIVDFDLPRTESVSVDHLTLDIEENNNEYNPIAAVEAIDDQFEHDTHSLLGAPNGAADRLERSAELLSQIPSLRSIADGLSAKAKRFRNKSFTIALFGAFSAGKSSFANALVGKSVLPVSPNPTTATINRILAPSGDNQDGTALIMMKSLEAFEEDIRHSLKRIGISQEALHKVGSDIPKLLALKEPVSANELHPRGRPHLAFLYAAAQGWKQYGALLGTRFIVQEEEYRRYAAEEQASCFVAEIDLFVDSPITRSGAVLVDTPGADSINARHTGVAFQYIKNADAVLFVTYYNHAFTEADREFLNQLGSVKDVFELDKMFFIINAADLASSESELESVQAHVGSQLLKHGIRKPRLFAVSSLQGLHAKRSGDSKSFHASGIAAFEKAFRGFSEEELGGLALASANKELDRVDRLLESWLQSANEDAATREAKAARLQSQAEQWRSQGGEQIPTTALQPLQQEINEQFYHLRQRLRFRFKDHFQAAFHPSVLQDDGRDLKKMLQACGEDLKRSLNEDLKQELRAAGLRLEGTVYGMMEKALNTMTGIQELSVEGFSPEPAERQVLEMPLPESFAEGPQLDSRRLWSSFRTPKHFFELEGAAALREQLYETLFSTIDAELSILTEQWNHTAATTLLKSIQAGANGWAGQLTSFANSMSDALRKPGEERLLTDLQEQWRKIRQ
ncbi:dynamin family protein [Cohnella sp.]|uniref:dynamin family protein n=1 Tax=Cohnella sp. TaxID=1883426 RepID=UPI0035612C94